MAILEETLGKDWFEELSAEEQENELNDMEAYYKNLGLLD